MLTSSTDTDDGPRVLALERHQDVAGAQIGGVGVLGVGRDQIRERARAVAALDEDRVSRATGTSAEETRLGFGRDEEVRHR